MGDTIRHSYIILEEVQIMPKNADLRLCCLLSLVQFQCGSYRWNHCYPQMGYCKSPNMLVEPNGFGTLLQQFSHQIMHRDCIPINAIYNI